LYYFGLGSDKHLHFSLFAFETECERNKRLLKKVWNIYSKKEKENCFVMLAFFFLKSIFLNFLKAPMVRTELKAKILLKKTLQRMLEKLKPKPNPLRKESAHMAWCPLNLLRLFSK
jgi:hypothetical protein